MIVLKLKKKHDNDSPEPCSSLILDGEIHGIHWATGSRPMVSGSKPLGVSLVLFCLLSHGSNEGGQCVCAHVGLR